MARSPAARGQRLKFFRPTKDAACPYTVGESYLAPLDFRIRRTSMKVSAVVTEITEPNKIIRIAELSISLSLPSHRQFLSR